MTHHASLDTSFVHKARRVSTTFTHQTQYFTVLEDLTK